MYLIPEPQQVRFEEGIYTITFDKKIVLHNSQHSAIINSSKSGQTNFDKSIVSPVWKVGKYFS